VHDCLCGLMLCGVAPLPAYFIVLILHTITAWITRLFVWIDAVAAGASLPAYFIFQYSTPSLHGSHDSLCGLMLCGVAPLPAYFIVLILHTITAWITRLFVWVDAVAAGASLPAYFIFQYSTPSLHGSHDCLCGSMLWPQVLHCLRISLF